MEKDYVKNVLLNIIGICQECYFQLKAQSIDEENGNIFAELQEYKKSIIGTLIKGGILGVILEVFFIACCQVELEFGTFVALLFAFFLPIGYITISKVIGKDPYREEKNTFAYFGLGSQNNIVREEAQGYFIGKFIGFFLKVIISMFIGIPCTIYLVVKLISTNKKLVNWDSNYNAQVDSLVKEMETQKNN